MTVLALYVVLFVGAWIVVGSLRQGARRNDLTARKTVTFGDESAVRADRVASVISLATVFLIWGAFTGSTLVPLHVPGPFVGDTSFRYSARLPSGDTADAEVLVRVHPPSETPDAPKVALAAGSVRHDSAAVPAWRSVLIKAVENDGEGAQVVAINGTPLTPGETVRVANGKVVLTPKGSLSFTPDSGWQMEPIWLPPPEAVIARLIEIARAGYQGTGLADHLWASVSRVLAGFILGTLIGVPLGYAMGLSGWVRGWFDPIVEFMRPVPPLALIPLIIIWFGIWETGKIVLLFLAALWIMVIAARSGVSGIRLSKIHAAYSLGASKTQVLWHVIIPNSLPDIFTGARVAMGVCWGTVVAAELVAAEKGAGMMILVASKFQLTDIVVMGIILIGIIGYGIDILMRLAEKRMVPWKGRG
jgi:taurine transport system permease protein